MLIGWLDADRKVTPLKTLQGLIWADGYRSGALRGHVYADAIAGLQRWYAAGIKLYVYSSGSVAAQRLLFGYSVAGDLQPLFAGYFDTTAGAKDAVASYARIVGSIGYPPERVLFLSDRAAELAAAQGAGLQVLGVARLTDTSDAAVGSFPSVSTFDAIELVR